MNVVSELKTEKNSCGIARFPCDSTAFLYGFAYHRSTVMISSLCVFCQNSIMNSTVQGNPRFSRSMSSIESVRGSGVPSIYTLCPEKEAVVFAARCTQYEARYCYRTRPSVGPSVRLSVCLSVTLMYCGGHTCWTVVRK